MKLTVSQNVNKLNLTATQNETVVELQPVIYIEGRNEVFVESDPVFTSSEAYLFVEGDKAALDNVVTTVPQKLDKPILQNTAAFDHIVVVDSDNRSSKIPKSSVIVNVPIEGISFEGVLIPPVNKIVEIPSFEDKIEVIKRNGTSLPIVNKEVDIQVPTKTSDLTNDSNFITLSDIPPFDDKIEIIKRNGVELPINNKEVDLIVPTKTSDLINDSNFSTITKHSELVLDDGTNPHGTTKTDIGLGNVDNTSDLNKPISTATQNALDGKLDKNTSTTTDTMMYVKNPDGTQGVMPIYNKPRTFSYNTLFNITNTATATFKSISLTGSSPTYNADTSISIPEELISHTPFKWQLSVPFNCKLVRVSMSLNAGSNNQLVLVKGDNVSASASNKILVYKGNSGNTQPIDDRSPFTLSNLNKYDFISLYIMTALTTGTNYGFINLEFEEI